jgi:hypothetical protein
MPFFDDVEEGPESGLEACMGGVGIDFQVAEGLTCELVAKEVIHAAVRATGKARNEAQIEIPALSNMGDRVADLPGEVPDIPRGGCLVESWQHVSRHDMVSPARDLSGERKIHL